MKKNPLIELHLHLEGSIYPSDAAHISGTPASQLEPLFRHEDFNDFLKHFGRVVSLMRSGDDLRWLLGRHLERLRSQGCVYAEVRVSPSVWERFGIEPNAAMKKLLEIEVPGIAHCFIVEAVRHWERQLSERDLDLALEMKGRVRGFGIGGDEAAAPVSGFCWAAEACRKDGIAFIPHAGEVCGAEEVAAALEMGSRRIGHGIRSVDDPGLCENLADEGIHLEVCPTSNLRTGAVKTGEVHPLRLLWERNVPFSVSTDDPGLFLTTLEDEMALAASITGFGEEGSEVVTKEALRVSLLEKNEKDRLGTILSL